MDATKKVDATMKVVGKASSSHRGANDQRVKHKKKKLPADNLSSALTQEGGEAEDDFGGVAVLDLAEEAALVAGEDAGEVEFLTGLREEGGGQRAEPQRQKKRKKDAKPATGSESQAEQETALAVKKRKKKQREEVARDIEGSAERIAVVENGNASEEKSAIALHENPRALPLPDPGADRIEQADWFGGCYQAHFGGALSSLEQAVITERNIASGSGSGAPLPPALKQLFGPRWQEPLLGSSLAEGQEAGSPAVLIVAASAKRCVEVLKTLTEFNAGCRVAKLFAKHFKVEEQVEVLKKRVNVAAGTPNRLLKLTELSALSLASLKVLVLDLQRDAKGLTVVDIPETRIQFLPSGACAKVLENATKEAARAMAD